MLRFSRILSVHILHRNESRFTHSNLDFKKNFPGETSGPLCREVGKGRGRDQRVHTSKGSADGKDRGKARGMGEKRKGRGQRQGGLALRF